MSPLTLFFYNGLDPRLRSEIDRMARRSRRSFSTVMHDLLEEALRMRSCPGIYFADEPAGREAKVAGTGLGVWEVVRDYLAAHRDERTLRKASPPALRRPDARGLLYYAKVQENGDLLQPPHQVLPGREYQDLFHGLPEKDAEVLFVHGEEVRRATG